MNSFWEMFNVGPFYLNMKFIWKFVLNLHTLLWPLCRSRYFTGFAVDFIKLTRWREEISVEGTVGWEVLQSGIHGLRLGAQFLNRYITLWRLFCNQFLMFPTKKMAQPWRIVHSWNIKDHQCENVGSIHMCFMLNSDFIEMCPQKIIQWISDHHHVVFQ